MSIIPVSSTAISISWSVPDGSVVTSYGVEWSSNQCPDDLTAYNTTTLSGENTNYELSHLRPGTSYNISVKAVNLAGLTFSDLATTKTEEIGKNLAAVYTSGYFNAFIIPAPFAPPSPVRVTNVTPFNITIHWGMVPCDNENGEITGFSVSFSKVEGESQGAGTARSPTSAFNVTSSGVASGCSMPVSAIEGSGNHTVNVPHSQHDITLTGLSPSTNYSITVAAVNSAGIGTQSDPLFVETNGEFLKWSTSNIKFTIHFI